MIQKLRDELREKILDKMKLKPEQIVLDLEPGANKSSNDDGLRGSVT